MKPDLSQRSMYDLKEMITEVMVSVIAIAFALDNRKGEFDKMPHDKYLEEMSMYEAQLDVKTELLNHIGREIAGRKRKQFFV